MNAETLKALLDTYGIALGDITMEDNRKNKAVSKKFKNIESLTEDDILNAIYKGDDESMVLDLLESLNDAVYSQEGTEHTIEVHKHGIRLDMLNNQDFAKVSDEEVWEKFLDNPDEKQMRVFLKDAVAKWKQLFKEKKATQENKDNTLYTDADLQKVLLGLDICTNMDICLIRILNEREKLEKNLGEKSLKFGRDVQAFEQDLTEYEQKFNQFQIECEDIADFEEKLKNYLTDCAQKSGGKTLEDKDKDLFNKKRELEQAYSNDKRTYKRLLGYFCDAIIAKNKLEKRMQEDKNSNMEKYYGTLTTCFKVPDNFTELMENTKKEESIHNEMFKRFASVCQKQLYAKQKLKDMHSKVKEYKDASYKAQKEALV